MGYFWWWWPIEPLLTLKRTFKFMQNLIIKVSYQGNISIRRKLRLLKVHPNLSNIPMREWKQSGGLWHDMPPPIIRLFDPLVFDRSQKSRPTYKDSRFSLYVCTYIRVRPIFCGPITHQYVAQKLRKLLLRKAYFDAPAYV